MTEQTKSQWDFGELFPVEATHKVLTVAERNIKLQGALVDINPHTGHAEKIERISEQLLEADKKK
jgi:calcineurin-like phosphoesterase